ncbi:unnamed protein product [Closterium sp. NIES-64]|nr:unnamed protein product [Closterium sp. NIES-64]
MAGSLRAASSFLGVGISHPKLAVKVPPNLRRSTASGRKINTDRDGNSRKSRGVQVRARADGEISLLLDFSKVFSSTPAPGEPVVSVDNESSENYTIITVSAQNRPGLLQLLTLTFRDLGLDVGKAVVDLDDDGNVADAFYVTAVDGKKITQKRDLQNIRKCVVRALVLDAKGDSPKDAPVRPARLIRPVTTLDPSASPEMKRRTELLHNLMDTYIKNDVLSIQRSIVDHVEYTMARSRYKFDDFEAYQATAYSVRDRLIESWNDTQQYFKDQDSKRVYYLSMEFLMGRSLLNSIFNLGMKDQYVEALGQLGYKLEVLAEQERDAALGNGGLGRLAACVLDSMATLNYPGWGFPTLPHSARLSLPPSQLRHPLPVWQVLADPAGRLGATSGHPVLFLTLFPFPSPHLFHFPLSYGIRYQYGMFRQTLQDGFQHEQPDYWLTFGNPWEIERVFVTYPVRFYGTVESYTEAGYPRKRWVEGETVEAVAYDNPIPGYHTNNTINLRLWGAKPSGEFDLQSFNTGDYVNAILSKQKAEAISSVLYPDDRTYQGKELRLKQQHFFVSATMQDVVRRYKEEHSTFDEFKDKVALQLNDTHPVLALVELMRLLVDQEGLEWGYAWNITTHTFSYTNHTVLPEALEKWPVEILETLLPRHLELIYDINHNFIVDLKKRIGNDYDRLSRMSIIEEGAHKSIRMATLAVVTCHTINGVSQIHTDLIENTLFKDFYDIWPHKFQNKTNGVTQRRWLAFCNLGLAAILTHSDQLSHLSHSAALSSPKPPPPPSASLAGVLQPGAGGDPDPFRSTFPLVPLCCALFSQTPSPPYQRRWLAFCNPGLAAILTQWLGTESWITNLDLVAGLKEHVDDPLLQTQWMQVGLLWGWGCCGAGTAVGTVRRQNKARLAAYIEGISGIKVSIDAMFDVQVKRIHEYKRQLLNVMGIIHRYDCIKKMSPEERKRVVPRVCLLGGKAAPGYDLAKKIVKLISAVSEVINKDEDVGDLLKLQDKTVKLISGVSEVINKDEDVGDLLKLQDKTVKLISGVSEVINKDEDVGDLLKLQDKTVKLISGVSEVINKDEDVGDLLKLQDKTVKLISGVSEVINKDEDVGDLLKLEHEKIVKLRSAVSEVINNDEDVGDLLKLVRWACPSLHTLCPLTPMPSHPLPSHPLPSHPPPSHPLPSYPLPSHPLPSHPLPSHLLPAGHQVFIPDYNVSLAELIIPASDLSQHISTAGNEASGTSNMKFAMNGCLILGTLDGATREIREEIGPENMFVFGAETKDVPRLREERRTFTPCRNFTRVVGMIRSGYFGWTEFFAPLMDSIDGPGNDYYLLANDFSTYLEAQVRPSPPTWRPRCARPHLPGGPGAPFPTYLEAQVRPSSPTWRPRCALPHLPGGPGAPFPTYLEAQVPLPYLPGGPGAPFPTYLEAQVRPSPPTWRPRGSAALLGALHPPFLCFSSTQPNPIQAAIDATNVDVPKQTHMSISSTAGAWFGYPPLPPPFTFPFLPPFSLSPGGHRCNAAIDATYVDVPKWTRMSISSTAGCGRFTSDRTIKEYAEEIWDVQPITRPY